MAEKTKASFIQPMLLVPTEKLSEGENWLYELKLDGYRAIAFKAGGKVYLRSRNNKDFNTSYPGIGKALADLPFRSVADNWAHMSLLILGS
jgi:bifunctional non-homologous end joining protein LigD